jgi:hypothetical protein
MIDEYNTKRELNTDLVVEEKDKDEEIADNTK